MMDFPLTSFLDGTVRDPHAHLGMHPEGDNLQVRVFAPGVDTVTLIAEPMDRPKAQDDPPVAVPLERLHDAGLFAGTVSSQGEVFPYRLRMSSGGHTWERGDPYRFLPTIGGLDLYYIGEGTHDHLYEVLGAHPRIVDEVSGVSFAVWAPNARAVSLIGNFNGWNRRSHPMRTLGSSGVWELFVPGLQAGEIYKYAIRGADGWEREKSDPLALATELRPRTASVIARLDGYEWGDDEWLARRKEVNPYSSPMSIYEVHLGSWRRHPDGSWLSYRELAEQLVPYAKELSYTHLELLPVTEHPYDGSWGYQVTGFYAPTRRHGTPDDFRHFVDACHQAGIGVFMDWAPAHFAVDVWALAQFDGTYLYEHQDERRRVQPDWGTYTFNYGRTEVRNFLTANALYWVREFHIDGLRVDGVSSMLYLDYSRNEGEWAPNLYGGREHLEAIDFLRGMNEAVYAEGTGAITIAEESTAWWGVSKPTYEGGLGFGFKWNMGWMHDTLDYLAKDPLYRAYLQGMLTFSMVYAFDENFILSLSHDEVVHGKRSLISKLPGDEWRQFANLRLLHAYQHAQPGKKLLFMGGEFGQRHEWDEARALEWQALDYGPHRGVLRLVTDLNALHRNESALHSRDHDPTGFEWLDLSDESRSVISFVRRGTKPGDHIVCVLNFTPMTHSDYRIPAPDAGRYQELLNTDAVEYGGSGVRNAGGVVAERHEHHGVDGSRHAISMAVTLPPLAALFLKPER